MCCISIAYTLSCISEQKSDKISYRLKSTFHHHPRQNYRIWIPRKSNTRKKKNIFNDLDIFQFVCVMANLLLYYFNYCLHVAELSIQTGLTNSWPLISTFHSDSLIRPFKIIRFSILASPFCLKRPRMKSFPIPLRHPRRPSLPNKKRTIRKRPRDAKEVRNTRLSASSFPFTMKEREPNKRASTSRPSFAVAPTFIGEQHAG